MIIGINVQLLNQGQDCMTLDQDWTGSELNFYVCFTFLSTFLTTVTSKIVNARFTNKPRLYIESTQLFNH